MKEATFERSCDARRTPRALLLLLLPAPGASPSRCFPTRPAGASRSSPMCTAPDGVALGRHLRRGHLRAEARREDLGTHPHRHDRHLHLDGLHQRHRVRPAGRSVVRHGGQRLGPVGRTAARPGATGPSSSSGPEWQYVAPEGISTEGDTTLIGTADGVQVTTDNGEHWIAIIDGTGPPAARPGRYRASCCSTTNTCCPLGREGRMARQTLTGHHVLAAVRREVAPRRRRRSARRRRRASPTAVKGKPLVVQLCGGRVPVPAPASGRLRLPSGAGGTRGPPGSAGRSPARQRQHRPDLSLRQHHGRLLPAASGRRVQQSRWHAGAARSATAWWSMPGRRKRARSRCPSCTTATLPVNGDTLFIFSVYYHNSGLDVKVGDRVAPGEPISRVGNTGRATNDHLHLEVHAAPDTTDRRPSSTRCNRYPALYHQPRALDRSRCPAPASWPGQVRDAAGASR